MALQKLKTYDNGFTSEYHKIISMHIDYIRRNVQVVVCSYKDQSTRDSNMSEVERRGYQFEFPESVQEISRETAYSALKEMAEFEGAVDI